jgi:hypothetical protein
MYEPFRGESQRIARDPIGSYLILQDRGDSYTNQNDPNTNHLIRMRITRPLERRQPYWNHWHSS